MARLKEWEELTVADNFLFQRVMQNENLCKTLIEKILKRKIKEVYLPELEKVIDIDSKQKSVRLDLYVKTDDDIILDIEMQTTDNPAGELPKRARYYQGMIDLDTLVKGDDFEELKESYVIFICTFDPFNSGRVIYTFKNICKEDKRINLNDKATKIFVNAKGNKGEIDDEFKGFLDYLIGMAPSGNFAEAVSKEAERIKLHKETRLEYMTYLMELRRERREAYKEGEVKGEAKERLSSIRNLIEATKWSIDKAMDTLKIPVNERESYKAKILGGGALN